MSITTRRLRSAPGRGTGHRHRRAPSRTGVPTLAALTAAATTAFLLPAGAHAADTLFANIGSFTTYSPSGGSAVAGPGATGFQVISEGVIFTPTVTGQSSLIELTLSRTVGFDPFRITLYTAAPNGFPQTQLFTTVGPAPVASGSPIPLASFSALAGPGTIYRNEAGAERTIAAERAPGLRLSGSLIAVPEPGTLTLTLLPLGMLALTAAGGAPRARRRGRV